MIRSALVLAAIVLGGCDIEVEPQTDDANIVALSVMELQQRIAAGELSAEAVTRAYLRRIESLDQKGPRLNAIIEINPDAVSIAQSLDRALAEGGPVGSLHGIPVVLKANIDTGDRMATSAGSLALADHHAPDDAALVARLRAAGAVLIAKANLSEWANFRGSNSISGWSSLGGQTRNAYVLDRNPCGSSSGSAVAVAARLGPLAVGTETDGSIVCPSSINGVVGIKPTLGLVEQDGIIPIAASQDTAGPMARTVAGAALLLEAMANPQMRTESYMTERDNLRGLRIGVVRDYRGAGQSQSVETAYETWMEWLVDAGAELVDPINLDIDDASRGNELEVLLYEFKTGLEQYLLSSDAPHDSLTSLIRFNEDNAGIVMPHFGQELFLSAAEKGSLDDAAYVQARRNNGDYLRNLIDSALDRFELDLLIAPTNAPAWKTDNVHGDRFLLSSSSVAAVSGYPSITVPGSLEDELPIGLSFIGRPFEESALVGIASVFEQTRGRFAAPRFIPSLETAGIAP